MGAWAYAGGCHAAAEAVASGSSHNLIPAATGKAWCVDGSASIPIDRQEAFQ